MRAEIVALFLKGGNVDVTKDLCGTSRKEWVNKACCKRSFQTKDIHFCIEDEHVSSLCKGVLSQNLPSLS